jgi:hypothetical protein
MQKMIKIGDKDKKTDKEINMQKKIKHKIKIKRQTDCGRVKYSKLEKLPSWRQTNDDAAGELKNLNKVSFLPNLARMLRCSKNLHYIELYIIYYIYYIIFDGKSFPRQNIKLPCHVKLRFRFLFILNCKEQKKTSFLCHKILLQIPQTYVVY